MPHLLHCDSPQWR